VHISEGETEEGRCGGFMMGDRYQEGRGNGAKGTAAGSALALSGQPFNSGDGVGTVKWE
jgi:hypothetical protein